MYITCRSDHRLMGAELKQNCDIKIMFWSSTKKIITSVSKKLVTHLLLCTVANKCVTIF